MVIIQLPTTMASQRLCLSRQEDRAPIDTMGWKRVKISAARRSFTMTTAWMLPVATSGWVLLDFTLSMILPIHQRFPRASFDLPLVIADRQFDAKNQIPYVFNPNGVTGDKFLVNGVYQPYLEVGDRKYRFRILDASNFRTYFLELSNGDSFIQIGTESGLLPAPVTRTGMRMGPAERLDVVVDFAGELGQNIYLVDALTGTQLLEFRVTQHVTDDSSIPATLRPLPDIGEPTVTRNWSFDQAGGHWAINGLRFDPNRVDARPVLGTTEKWVFTNPTGQPHTVHIHDVSQQCVSRNGGACYPYETMKETWYLTPGETLR